MFVLIDDNQDHLDLLARLISDEQQRCGNSECVETFSDPAEALAKLPADGPAVILCDHNLGGTTGLEWLPDLARANVGPVILMTAEGDDYIAAEAFRLGAADYVRKSAIFDDPDHLLRSIREASRRYSLERKNRDLARELKIANKGLARNNRKLAELTDTAHQFVDNVAHEFRTPLTVIKEFSSILQDGLAGAMNDKQIEYLGFVTGAASDLAQLVDDFLDSSKIKARTLRVDRRPHRPQAVIDSVQSMLEARAKPKGVGITYEVEPTLHDVFVDLEKAGRTLVNIVVNAIKFSPEASSIRIEVVPRGDTVEYRVHHQGPGLSDEEVQRVFNRFKQVGDAQQTSAKGFGLGLNIAKELAWLNLGRMQVESRPGAGSCFSFSVPSCDPEAVLNAYLDAVGSVETGRRVTILCDRQDGSSDDVERLREFLVSTCHPTDLIMPSVDRRNLLMLGLCDEPDAWIKRLLSAHRERDTFQPDAPLPPLDPRWIGSWSCSHERETIFASAFGRIMGLARCA